MKEWHTASELAGLPTLPATKYRLRQRAERETWVRRPRSGRGGGYEYHIDSLPADARIALGYERPVAGKAERTQPDTSQLAEWQRTAMTARVALLEHIDSLVPEAGGRRRAIDGFVAAAKAGDLDPALQTLIPIANAKSNGRATVSRGTIYRWIESRTAQASSPAALAPAAPPPSLPPRWAAPLLSLYGQPQKPALTECVDRLPALLGEGAVCPSYDQARRFLDKLSPIAKNKGRMGPRELKKMKAYVARDVSELWPTAIYCADGHTFDAEVAHPRHGGPFRPEITTVIDVFSRRVVGWSIALSEATWGVMDALRHAVETSGCCDIWYVDNGKGFNNKAFDAELTGFLSRLGITKKNSLPYSSQARGVIERIHQSIWIRGARELPTYVGVDMDPEARHKAFKITRAAPKPGTTSRRLTMEWPHFIEWCTAQVDAYNNRSHRSLKGQSPNQAWDREMANGWQPDLMIGPEAEDLFRPYEKRKTSRCQVSLFGNRYFSLALEEFHGDDVMVGYDIHDAEKVWVRTLDQRLICTAEFEGNKTAFYPVAVVEQARERRAATRMKRLAVHAQEVKDELSGTAILNLTVDPLTPAQKEAADEKLAQLTNDEIAPPAREGRPLFGSDIEWAAWLSGNPTEATDDDRALLMERRRDNSFCRLMDINGIYVDDLMKAIAVFQLVEGAE